MERIMYDGKLFVYYKVERVMLKTSIRNRLQAQNSKSIKLRPTEFKEQLKFDLRQKIKEAAVTNLQFWDEVNRKK
jgi:hypothetical protein